MKQSLIEKKSFLIIPISYITALVIRMLGWIGIASTQLIYFHHIVAGVVLVFIVNRIEKNRIQPINKRSIFIVYTLYLFVLEIVLDLVAQRVSTDTFIVGIQRALVGSGLMLIGVFLTPRFLSRKIKG